MSIPVSSCLFRKNKGKTPLYRGFHWSNFVYFAAEIKKGAKQVWYKRKLGWFTRQGPSEFGGAAEPGSPFRPRCFLNPAPRSNGRVQEALCSFNCKCGAKKAGHMLFNHPARGYEFGMNFVPFINCKVIIKVSRKSVPLCV